ncbi:MFS transporter [Zymobacter sp. IVIA_5232.4 C2]|uniref:MFS transporter n=1 Tax=Zymobacter sp. IVIA_5232.4 C2 TaxID=3394855 RepID=UPI0039C0253F
MPASKASTSHHIMEDGFPAPPSTPWRRLSIAFFFALSGLALTNWTTRVPSLKERFGLDDGHIGLLLFCPVVGTLTSVFLANYLVARFGSRRMTRLGSYFIVASLFAIGWAQNVAMLAGALFLYGVGTGLMNIAMNDQAATLERRYRRSIMASFHGMFSLGMMIGGAFAGLLIRIGLSPQWHLTLVSLLLLAGALSSKRLLIQPPPKTERQHGKLFVFPRGRVWLVGAIASATVFVEGSLTDWASVFLKALEAPESTAALGVTCFAAAMTSGRLFGDRWIEKAGPKWALQIGGSLSILGLGMAVFTGQLYLSLIGFAMTGLGLSTLFPCLLSLARSNPLMTSSAAISSVAMMGYVALLAGPSILGFLAHAVGVRWAFIALILSSGVIVLMASSASRQHA